MAADFKVGNLYYNIISSNPSFVELAIPEPSSGGISFGRGYYSGDVDIPSMVEHNGITYTVTGIGQDALSGSSSLVSVSIPATVSSMGTAPFAGCTNLRSITVEENNAYYKSIDDVLYDKDATTLLACASRHTEIFIVEDGISTIGAGAFYGCSSLTSVILPNSLREIGDKAFYCCSNMLSVNLPEGLETIGNEAFYECTKLSEATLPTTLKKLGSWAFRYCISLSAANIPSSVELIGVSPFGGCTKISAIQLSGTNKNYSCIDGVLMTADGIAIINFPAGRTGMYALPEKVRVIGEGAFFYCKGLEKVIMREGIEEIGSEAFAFCSKITSVSLPSTIIEMGAFAFNRCDGLKSIITRPLSPPSMPDNAFSNYLKPTLYVPRESYDLYQTADGWLKFTHISIIPETNLTIEKATTPNGCTGEVSVSLNNDETMPIHYCSMTLHLPDGISMATNEQGNYIYTLSERNTSTNPYVNIRQNNAGTYTVSYFSRDLMPIAGNTGELLSLGVYCDDDVAQGILMGYATNIIISDMESDTDLYLLDSDIAFDVFPIDKGDVNADGQISLIDIMMMVNYILGAPDPLFFIEKADCTGDGSISLADIILVIDAILSDTPIK